MTRWSFWTILLTTSAAFVTGHLATKPGASLGHDPLVTWRLSRDATSPFALAGIRLPGARDLSEAEIEAARAALSGTAWLESSDHECLHRCVLAVGDAKERDTLIDEFSSRSVAQPLNAREAALFAAAVMLDRRSGRSRRESEALEALDGLLRVGGNDLDIEVDVAILAAELGFDSLSNRALSRAEVMDLQRSDHAEVLRGARLAIREAGPRRLHEILGCRAGEEPTVIRAMLRDGVDESRLRVAMKTQPEAMRQHLATWYRDLANLSDQDVGGIERGFDLWADATDGRHPNESFPLRCIADAEARRRTQTQGRAAAARLLRRFATSGKLDEAELDGIMACGDLDSATDVIFAALADATNKRVFSEFDAVLLRFRPYIERAGGLTELNIRKFEILLNARTANWSVAYDIAIEATEFALRERLPTTAAWCLSLAALTSIAEGRLEEGSRLADEAFALMESDAGADRCAEVMMHVVAAWTAADRHTALREQLAIEGVDSTNFLLSLLSLREMSRSARPELRSKSRQLIEKILADADEESTIERASMLSSGTLSALKDGDLELAAQIATRIDGRLDPAPTRKITAFEKLAARTAVHGVVEGRWSECLDDFEDALAQLTKKARHGSSRSSFRTLDDLIDASAFAIAAGSEGVGSDILVRLLEFGAPRRGTSGAGIAEISSFGPIGARANVIIDRDPTDSGIAINLTSPWNDSDSSVRLAGDRRLIERCLHGTPSGDDWRRFMPAARRLSNALLGHIDWLQRLADHEGEPPILTFRVTEEEMSFPFAALLVPDSDRFLGECFRVTVSTRNFARPESSLIDDAIHMSIRRAVVCGLGPTTASGVPGLESGVEECRRIAQRLNCESLGPNQATIQAVLDLARRCDFLHIVTHASPANDASRESSLVFSTAKGEERLGAGVIESQRFANHPEIVISACGKPRDRRQVACAFLRAGARRVVAAVAPISDRDTTEFMTSLYADAVGNDRIDLQGALRSMRVESAARIKSGDAVREFDRLAFLFQVFVP